MKTKKQILSIFLAIALIIAIIPTSSITAEDLSAVISEFSDNSNNSDNSQTTELLSSTASKIAPQLTIDTNTVETNALSDATIENVDGVSFTFVYGPEKQYGESYAKFPLTLPEGTKLSDYKGVSFTYETAKAHYGKRGAFVLAPAENGLPDKLEFNYGDRTVPNAFQPGAGFDLPSAAGTFPCPVTVYFDYDKVKDVQETEFEASIFINCENFDQDITMQYTISDITFFTVYYDLQNNTSDEYGNSTIKLTQDIAGDSQLTIGRDLTLDLNGHTLDIELDATTGQTSNAIKVNSGKTLTIIDSSNDDSGVLNTANLSNSSSDGNGAAINVTDGTLIIGGGTINAQGGYRGAGIGGGFQGDGGVVTINGGTVNALGGSTATGIGGGGNSGDGVGNGGTVTINGGEVYAQGGLWSAGIGGGPWGTGGNIFINGGTVTAVAGDSFDESVVLAMGLSSRGTPGTVTVTGEYNYWTSDTTNTDPGGLGTYGDFNNDTTTFDPTNEYKFIKLTENPYSALKKNTSAANGADTIKLTKDITGASQLTIGRDLTLDLNGFTLDIEIPSGAIGNNSNGIKIESGITLIITDSSAEQTGTLNVISKANSTNLDYGAAINNTDATVIIQSGTVNATGGYLGAGIGGGRGSDGGEVTINGGTVNAKGGDVSAGIGGGINGAGGVVTINGGNITATAGNEAPTAIGHGNNYPYSDFGTVKVNGAFDYWTNTDNTAPTEKTGGEVFDNDTTTFAPTHGYKYIKLAENPCLIGQHAPRADDCTKCGVCDETIPNSDHISKTDNPTECQNCTTILVICEACGERDCEKVHVKCDVCDTWDCTAVPCHDCGECEYCTSAATVINVTPNSIGADINGHIEITFSKPMDANLMGNVWLNSLPHLVGGSWTDDKTYKIPYSGLDYGTYYTVCVTGFRDLDGNAVETNNSFSFKTAVAPPIGNISVVGDTHILLSKTYGYGVLSPVDIRVRNTGNAPTGALMVENTGKNANKFMIVNDEVSHGINTGEEALLQIVPQPALAAGIYDATIIIRNDDSSIYAEVDLRFVVNKAEQSKLVITDPGVQTWGDEPFNLEFTGGNGEGNITFERVTGSDDVAEVNINGIVFINGVGEITVRARKAGDANYNEAVSEIITIKIVHPCKSGENGHTSDNAKALDCTNPNTCTVEVCREILEDGNAEHSSNPQNCTECQNCPVELQLSCEGAAKCLCEICDCDCVNKVCHDCGVCDDCTKVKVNSSTFNPDDITVTTDITEGETEVIFKDCDICAGDCEGHVIDNLGNVKITVESVFSPPASDVQGLLAGILAYFFGS